MLVNKQELADILGISLPTLDEWIRKDPAFPVDQRGSKGVEWQFSAEAVLEYRKVQQQADQEAAEARRAQLDLYRLPLSGGTMDASSTAPLTPQQELALARKRRMDMDDAKAAGFLVETHVVRSKLGHGLTVLNKSLQGLPSQIGRRFALPEPTVLAMRDAIEDFQRELVRNLRDLTEPASDGGAQL